MRTIFKRFIGGKWDMSNALFKYPSTPHFSISNVNDIRSDKILESRVQNEIFNHEIIIEEKIDGANLGISFDHEANIILQNRGTLLTPPFWGQWQYLEKWLSLKKDLIFDVLSDRYILFGEWCYAKHSILYTHLPDYFLAFDIYDKKYNTFIDFDRRNNLLGLMNITAVPLIAKGVYSLDVLPEFITKSIYSNEISEGIYVRVSNNDETYFRAKIVRESFTQNIKEHWSSNKITKNKTLNY